ncbi:MAG: NfeD family protein [Abditibacteriota bacterium]|nr:NfeD family protein [Abditibacteriota bacterium]
MEFVWWSWLVISAVLLIFEMMTGTFAFLIFAIGCAVTSIPAYFGLSLVWQIVLLAVVCFIVFLIFKSNPSIWGSKSSEKFGADTTIGLEGFVVETIDKGKGIVKVKSEEWRAVSEDGEPIKEGSKVVVKAIEGVKLIVEKVKE